MKRRLLSLYSPSLSLQLRLSPVPLRMLPKAVAARVRSTVPLVRIAVTASIVPRAAVAVVSAPPPGAKPSAFISLGIAWLVVKLQDLIGYHVLK